MKRLVIVTLGVFVCLAMGSMAYAHCEIPCGIYNDALRTDLIDEHIATIEKSMQQIAELSKDEDKNMNQIVRWIENKEEHANQLQEIVTQYFMTQRVTPVAKKDSYAYNKYVRQTLTLHQMLVSAMKAKQTTDLEHVEALRSLASEFRTLYFGSTKGNVQAPEEDAKE